MGDPQLVLSAYRALAAQYPAMNTLHGSAKLRALAHAIHNQAELDDALSLIPDEPTRALFRARLETMTNFPR